MEIKGYNPKDFDYFFGLDVDKKSYEINIRDHNTLCRSKKIPGNPKILFNYIKKNYSGKRVICAYEAGPTGFGLYDYLTENAIPCLVVSPLAIPRPKNKTAKTNKIDAKEISENLQSGKLYSIRIPIGEYRELRHLIKVRENYASIRKRAKQRIKALLLQESLYEVLKDTTTEWSKEYIEKLKEIKSTPAVRYRMDMLLMDLEYAKTQTSIALQKLKEFCQTHAEVNKYMDYLKSIPGIGFIIAVTILAKTGNPSRLSNIRELAAFTGMVPWENSTGEVQNKGSITHFGNKTLRFLLIEAAWVAIRRDARLNQFYFRIKKRHHPSIASKKAIVAVGRKMTHIIYKVLKDQRFYVK